MLEDSKLRMRPYERQALKTIERIARDRGIWAADSTPFSSFSDLSDYLFSRYKLRVFLTKLTLPEDNFMVLFRKYSVQKLHRIINEQGGTIEDAEELAVAFPWKSGLFVISTWNLPSDNKDPRLILPEGKLVVYFWEDFAKALL